MNQSRTYTIKDLEILSGIKAHTIRIWEKRYRLFEPVRTDTNIRRYCNQELKKILSISMLLDKGYKISKLSKMCFESLNQTMNDQFIEEAGHEDFFSGAINNLMIAMLELDEMKFEKTFSKCVSKFGLEETLINVVYPFLKRVGFLWCTSDTLPAQEHFCSNLIRQKLYAAIDKLSDKSQDESPYLFLLYLPENEHHDIGLLIANFYMKKHGFKVVNLGANVPFEDLGRICQMTNPSHLLTFFITPKPIEEMNNYLEKLSVDMGSTIIFISGNEKLFDKLKLPPKVNYLKAIPELLAVLEGCENTQILSA